LILSDFLKVFGLAVNLGVALITATLTVAVDLA